MFRFLLILCCCLASATVTAQSQNDCIMIVFAYQGKANLPLHSHSFATFIGPRGDVSTISWMPASFKVRTTKAAPEPGKNFTLAETLAWANKIGAKVTAWGPYRISPELYQRSQAQIARLNSGAVGYKTLDRKVRGVACNCIHSVSDLGGPLKTGTSYGEPASQMVVKHLGRWILGPGPEQVKGALGLGGPGISWR